MQYITLVGSGEEWRRNKSVQLERETSQFANYTENPKRRNLFSRRYFWIARILFAICYELFSSVSRANSPRKECEFDVSVNPHRCDKKQLAADFINDYTE
jgi:hypothetical protein